MKARTTRFAHRFADGGEVREGRHEGIGDDVRARAAAWLVAGSPERKAASAPVRKPRVKASVAPAETPVRKMDADSVSDEDVIRSARAKGTGPDPEIPSLDEAKRMPVGERSFLDKHGDEIKRNLTNTMYALGGPGAGKAAIGVGKLVGGLAESAVKGFRAGRFEVPAARAVRDARHAADAAESAKESAASAAATTARRTREAAAKDVARRKASPRSERVRPDEESQFADEGNPHYKRGGVVRGRGDGIAQRGLTKGRMR